MISRVIRVNLLRRQWCASEGYCAAGGIETLCCIQDIKEFNIYLDNSVRLSMEDQIYKGLAIGAPYFGLIGMARAPLAAVMVGKTIGKSLESGDLPVYISRFGRIKEDIFITSPELKKRFGSRFDAIPTGAMGLYTYLRRLEQGLKQLMCGSRKFSTEYITRDDIAALTEDAAKVSGIKYIMDCDKDLINKILDAEE